MVNRIRAVIGSLLLVLLLGGCGETRAEWVEFGDETEELSSLTEPDNEETTGSEAEVPLMCVHICGAVNAPGVVMLPEGSRVEDALRVAGGFREDACTTYVNLAAKLRDGEQIYFPTEEEVRGSGTFAGETLSGKVNINTADETLLATLPGIGPSRAKDIITYREKNGPFESIRDIMKVSGIKEKLYEDIADLIVTE